MEQCSLLKLFPTLTQTEIEFLDKCKSEASFIISQVSFLSQTTQNTHQAVNTEIHLKDRYILQFDPDTSMIISGLKLDFTTKFRRGGLAEFHKQSSTKTIQSEKVDKIVLCYLEEPHPLMQSKGEKKPFFEKYIELQIISCSSSLLNFLTALQKKPIIEKVSCLKDFYYPTKKIFCNQTLSIFTALGKLKDKNRQYFICSYPNSTLQLHQKYEILFSFEVAFQAKDCGLFLPLRIMETENTIYELFGSPGLCSLFELISYDGLSMQQVQRVTQLVLRNSENLLEAGISVNELGPKNLLVEMHEQRIQNVYFSSYRVAHINSNPQNIGSVSQEDAQYRVWLEKIENHKKIGLLLYYMICKQENILEESSSINPDNILSNMIQLQDPDFPTSAQTLIKTLIHQNDIILSLEQLLASQFFMQEDLSPYI